MRKAVSTGCAAVLLAAANMSAAEPAVITPLWVTQIPAQTALTAGIAGIAVDGSGVTYVTGTTGSSSNTDITTAAIAADGTRLWTRTWDGPVSRHDQARALALGPGGLLYVTGNTPGPDHWARVVLLVYQASSGNLVDAIEYTSGQYFSEAGHSIAADAGGRVYIAGSTTGDGGDVLVLAYDASRQLSWQRTWDGDALAPYSQDTARKILLAPDGNPVVLVHGVAWNNQPDYVVLKYDGQNGNVIWQGAWGVSGGDYPRDMEIDAQGDVYVTGTGIDSIDKYATVKLRGGDGTVAWQAYDSAAVDNAAAGLALDHQGGVYVTGFVDPDGDRSNFNDDFYTVKRNALTGAFVWSRRYGSPCLYCYDEAADVVVDTAANVFVAGHTNSPPYAAEAIVFVLDAASGVERNRGTIRGDAGESAGFRELRFDPTFSLRASGMVSNATTGWADMFVGRYATYVGGPPACYYGSRATPCPSAPVTGAGGAATSAGRPR